MYLIDTNVVSELPRRRPHPAALAWLASQTTLTMSAVTVEELCYGVARAGSEQRKRLAEWLDRLLAIPPEILPVDERVARAAGSLRAERASAGVIMAQADALVAGTARVTGRVLVTRNVRHFEGCGVALLNPFGPGARGSPAASQRHR
jgi:predicted nucleic acid-binding protein